MNYFKIEMVCESPLTYDEMCDVFLESVIDYTEQIIKGEVGFASYTQIDEHGDVIRYNGYANAND